MARQMTREETSVAVIYRVYDREGDEHARHSLIIPPGLNEKKALNDFLKALRKSAI